MSVSFKKQVFDWETCKNVADFFAKIADYKSSFTSRHSVGAAEKAAHFARYIGFDSINIQKMYLVVALHDIGKIGYTYLILSESVSVKRIRHSLTDKNILRKWSIWRNPYTLFFMKNKFQRFLDKYNLIAYNLKYKLNAIKLNKIKRRIYYEYL